jgi:hypothetical protein
LLELFFRNNPFLKSIGLCLITSSVHQVPGAVSLLATIHKINNANGPTEAASFQDLVLLPQQETMLAALCNYLTLPIIAHSELFHGATFRNKISGIIRKDRSLKLNDKNKAPPTNNF